MDPLTPSQAAALRDAVRDRTNYLHKVRNRMYQLGARPGDRLYDLFAAAEAVLQRLGDELHDRSIVRGERRPWEPSPDDGRMAGP